MSEPTDKPTTVAGRALWQHWTDLSNSPTVDLWWRQTILAIEAEARADRDAEVAALLDGISWAWSIIANAGGGDWTRETPEWQEGARTWRDETMPWVSALLAQPEPKP